MADILDCSGDVVDLGNRGLRIASVFIIMIASGFGALMPIFLKRQSRLNVPKLTFFVCKYVGTGVIIATAWMHLLAPAAKNLSDPCLESRLGDYDWAFVIGLMTVILMFFIEMLVQRYDPANEDEKHIQHESEWTSTKEDAVLKESSQVNTASVERSPSADDLENQHGSFPDSSQIPGRPNDLSYPPGGEDHMAHGHDHVEGDSHGSLGGQLTSLFILEFGVLFHSVFIGLTLGTTDELVILLIVLVFHQMFEGLGLGSRLAEATWPKNKQWLPYFLGGLFALSTPIGIAAGIGAKPNNANDQKLINGIFDSISAGILMYTGLVELLAHEFMFNPHMRKAPLKTLLYAFGCVALGVFIMALLAKWA